MPMVKDSTLSKWQSNVDLEEDFQPRRTTISFLQQFARVYRAPENIRFANMIVN